MKMKNYFCCIILSFVCNAASSQSLGTSSVTLGVSPYGYTFYNLFGDDKNKDLNFNYYFKKVMGANICYEIQSGGWSFLTEASYTRGDFDYYKKKGESESLSYNMYQTDALMNIALTQYVGGTLFGRNKRVQFPLHIGAGAEYVEGGPVHNVCVHVGAKLRLKFYISNNLGIYVGGTARAGLGWKTDKNPNKEANPEKEKDGEIGLFHLLCAPDAGLVISF